MQRVRPGELPRLRIIFHFGAHYDRGDTRHFPALLNRLKPHFYAPEGAFATEGEVRRAFDQYDRLRYEVSGLSRADREKYLEKKYHRSQGFWVHQALAFMDADVEPLPLELHGFFSSWIGKFMKARKDPLFGRAWRFLHEGNLDEAIRLFKEERRQSSQIMRRRDDNIVSQATSKLLARILKRRPDLQKEPEIRVYAHLGEGHQFVYFALKGQPGIDVERVFNSPPHFEHSDRVNLQQRLLGKDVPVEDEQIGQLLISHKLMDLVSIPAVSEFERFQLCERYAEQFSLQELRAIFSRFNEVPENKRNLSFELKRHLAEKGIRLPANAKEFLREFENRVKARWPKRMWREPYRPGIVT